MESVDLYVAYGRKLASARRAADLTQAKVAEKVGLSRASIANIEAGKQRVFLDQIFELARAVGSQSLSEMLPGYESPKRSVRQKIVVTGARGLSREQERILSEIFQTTVQDK